LIGTGVSLNVRAVPCKLTEQEDGRIHLHGLRDAIRAEQFAAAALRDL
jgi:hypothetical protein